MAKKKKEEPVEVAGVEQFENLDNALNESGQFIEKHQKPILIGLGVVFAVVIAIFCVKAYYLDPREQEASESIYPAEQWFARDSFRLALDGNDDFMGFLDIANEYGCTGAGNVAKAYAGLCYKKLGEYKEALSYLEDFDADDKMLSKAIVGAIGDCYWDMDDAKKAVSYYEKAIVDENAVIAPIFGKRLAEAYLSMGENAKAEQVLEKLINQYPYASNIQDLKKLLQVAKN
jgi:tetratricopeptide (TPR) repeat protein